MTGATLAIGEIAKPRRGDLKSSIEAGDHAWNAVEREADGSACKAARERSELLKVENRTRMKVDMESGRLHATDRKFNQLSPYRVFDRDMRRTELVGLETEDLQVHTSARLRPVLAISPLQGIDFAGVEHVAEERGVVRSEAEPCINCARNFLQGCKTDHSGSLPVGDAHFFDDRLFIPRTVHIDITRVARPVDVVSGNGLDQYPPAPGC